MNNVDTELPGKMIERANLHKLPADHPMRTAAAAFAAADINRESPASYLGKWAQAKRAWCDYTGEPMA